MTTLHEFVVSVLKFTLICFAAARAGPFGQKIKLPLICTYVIVGLIASTTGLIKLSETAPLKFISDVGLGFICLSAGAELYMPQIRELFGQIMWISLGYCLAQFLVAFVVIYPALKFGLLTLSVTDFTIPQYCGIALLTSCVAIALAPGSVIGLVKEVKAKGPLTSLMLGLTVVACVAAIVLYALISSYAKAVFLGKGFSALAVLYLIISIACALCCGWIFGKIIIFLLWVNSKFPAIPAQWAILLVGYGFSVLADVFTDLSLKFLGAELTLESLLVTIMGGYVATNQVGNRARFLGFLSKASPYMFVPFFTLSGAKVRIEKLLAALVFSIAYFVARLVGCGIGCAIPGFFTKQTPIHVKATWLTVVPQGGLSFGLASKISFAFDPWGTDLATAVLGFVILNLVLGPIFTKIGLNMAQEIPSAAAGGDGDLMTPAGSKIRRVLVVGLRDVSVGSISRLLKVKCHVTVLDSDPDKLSRVRTMLAPDQIPVPTMENTKELSSEKIGKQGLLPPGATDSAEPRAESSKSLGTPKQSPSLADLSYSPRSDLVKGKSRSELLASSRSSSKQTFDFTAGDVDCRVLAVEKGLLESLHDCTPDINTKSCVGAIVALGDDRSNYAVAHYLLKTRGVRRVVCIVWNAAWLKPYAELGIIPMYSYSLSAAFLYKAALTPADSVMQLVNGRPGPALGTAVVKPEDLENVFLLQSQDEHIQFEKDHPGPAAEWLHSQDEEALQVKMQRDRSGYLSSMGMFRYTDGHYNEAEERLAIATLLGSAAEHMDDVGPILQYNAPLPPTPGGPLIPSAAPSTAELMVDVPLNK